MQARLLVVAALAGCGFHTNASIDAALPGDAQDGGIDLDAIDAPADAPLDVNPMAWTRRKTITIDGAKVTGGPLLNFPVLIDLPNDPNLAADAKSDGSDILFLAADATTKLAYQRQRFVKSTGELIAWVKLPALPSVNATTIYMYYGNPAAAEQQEVTATWDATYRGVWHLDETTGGAGAIKDATAFANHGTDQNGPVLNSTGMVGGAVTFDGTNDEMSIPDSASLDAAAMSGTFAMWVKFVDPSAGTKLQLVLTSSNTFGAGTHDGFSWSTQADGDYYFYPWAGDTNDYNLASNPFANNAWAYACVTLSFATKEVKLFVNGTQLGITVMNVPTLWTQLAQPAGWMWGGNPGDPANHFTGQLDELRVSSTVRSAGWIQTEYRNQSSPQTFYSVGVATIVN